MRLFISILFVFQLVHLGAQDTLRVMHYNLLDYGNSGFCTNSTNNTDQKDAYLRSIITYAKPDIFTVNEISELSTYQERLLSQVMNQSGYAMFEMAASPNLPQSYIVNQLYYNSEKLVLHSQEVAQSELRDIDLYKLYVKSDHLAEGDTIFIHCIVAHLKAGSGNDDENKRAIMIDNALNYLETNGMAGNYLIMGDFNLYDSAEEAFQMLLNNNDPVFRFYDPANAIGDWHEEINFSHVHTQSTRESSSGCGASGGMDDRFDFILMNEIISNQAQKVYYLENSYNALGQDGLRLNGSINDPPNNSLPAYLIDALYGMSDHLPVLMDIVVDESLDIKEENAPLQEEKISVRYNNPTRDKLIVHGSSMVNGKAEISLLNVSGITVYREVFRLKDSFKFTIPVDNLSDGMYVLRIAHPEVQFSAKLMVSR